MEYTHQGTAKSMHVNQPRACQIRKLLHFGFSQIGYGTSYSENKVIVNNK